MTIGTDSRQACDIASLPFLVPTPAGAVATCATRWRASPGELQGHPAERRNNRTEQ
jgi:hypothetical protein